MKVCAVIAEFNPFHNGHRYLFEKIKEMGFTHIVVIMSGNFVQRGEPSIVPKEFRVYPALYYGADLVIELPCVWAVSTAERFASAAVHIVNAIKCLDAIVFGSECGDIKYLTHIAELFENENFKMSLRQRLKEGMTFAKAVELAACEMLNDESVKDIIKKPNNILSLEYIKAVKRENSKIPLLTVKLSKSDNISTASEIRNLIKNRDFLYKKFLPSKSFEYIQKAERENFGPLDFMHGEKAILYKLKSIDKSYILGIPDISEGIENRIINSISNSRDLDEVLKSIKTKRYTMARIKRVILFAFLGIVDNIQSRFPPYVRILGFSEKGREILKFISLPVVSKFSDISNLSEFSKKVYEIECISTDLIGIFSNNVKLHESEKKFKIIKLNKR